MSDLDAGLKASSTTKLTYSELPQVLVTMRIAAADKGRSIVGPEADGPGGNWFLNNERPLRS